MRDARGEDWGAVVAWHLSRRHGVTEVWPEQLDQNISVTPSLRESKWIDGWIGIALKGLL